MTIDRPLIVIQPTPFCNIDCTYCYLRDRLAQKRAPMALIRRIADEVFSMTWWTGEFTFLWHLGEPLSLPTEYYDEAFAAIEQAAVRHGRQYVHSFQTNGTLLSERWVSFLQRHRVRIGVSVDGPRFIHDRCRRGRNGLGTHARTMNGIHLLRKAGIEFGTISVLTDYSLDFPDEIVSFFVENEIAEIAFNIDELEGVHDTTSFAKEGTAGRYRRFLERVLALIDQQRGTIRLRELWRNLPVIVSAAEPYNLGSQPLRIVSFDCEGNFSSFCPELRSARSERFKDFVMGNIMQQSLSAIRSDRVFQLVSEEVRAGLSKCERECGYWKFCGGGDPSSKFFQHGRFDVTETTTCKIHKQATVDAILNHLESKHLHAGQP